MKHRCFVGCETILYADVMLDCCCSVTKSCPSLCDPIDCSLSGFLSFIISRSLLKFMSIESVMLSNHFILCCPLLLLPSVFLSIRVFSNMSALSIRWLIYWSFSFSISPSNEYSGLISFRIDLFDLEDGVMWYNREILSVTFLCAFHKSAAENCPLGHTS